MYPSSETKEVIAPVPSSAFRSEALTVTLLTDDHIDEVMSFLAERPVHTFGIAGFIRNNGIDSPYNRGVFYGCRDRSDRLVGVALIGHFILFEARSDEAIEALARMSQTHKRVHMLLAEQEEVRTFWGYYHRGGQTPRLHCRELLLELRWPMEGCEPIPGLRLATREDLELVVPVHARTAFDESGINPLDVDPEGFRARCARRIEKGQTWVLVENGRLIFKAEIVSETQPVIYLEGIDVHPDERGKGYGSRCISQLTRDLLGRTESVAVLINEKNPGAVAFYQRAGFKLIAYYDTIFLESSHR
ncbi:MAG TPA: GNAT family N-acetyltransferase [Blastocatellia bacterium]|nr:GNAT family N-acetyltransferase [Blastocatellia bacterium]